MADLSDLRNSSADCSRTGSDRDSFRKEAKSFARPAPKNTGIEGEDDRNGPLEG